MPPRTRRTALDEILEAGNFGQADGIIPADWQRGTHCAWKPACVSTATRLIETTTLLEANLGWICKLDKAEFIGKESLVTRKQRA